MTEAKTAHTPGPWTWGDNFHGLYGSGPDNEVLTWQPYEGMWVSYGDKREPNARLIAAAPDLLEACKQQHQALDLLMARLIALDPEFMPTKAPSWEAAKAGHAAIVKATA